jgi:hypothetical protein
VAGRRIAVWLAALSVSASLFGAAAGDGIRSLLGIERRALTAETRRLADLSRRLDSAVNDLTAASRALADAAGRSDSALATASDAFTRALASVDAAAFDQRLCLERIRLLRERVGDLERESAAGRSEQEDPLSGDWRIRVDPGAQEGDLHFSLDGTIVTGSYSLQGGFTGSVRGTFVGDRVKIDRIDSRLGFLAVYYGRLMPDGVTITGTWEGTELNNAGPTSGTWTAERKPEPEEEP